MNRISPIAVIALSAAGALMSSRAMAADPPKPEGPKGEYVVDAPEVKADKRTDGWVWKLNTGATASFGDNRNVVGQPNGTSLNLGLKFDGAADFNRGKHEFRNLLSLAEGFSRTPIIPEFVKSSDSLALDSIYLHHFVEWAGLFGRFSLQTSVLRGADVRPPGTSFQITRADGRVDTEGGRPDALNRLPLTAPFTPMLLKESIGPFARPVTHEKFNLELRLGAGAREAIAKSQLAIKDDPKTATVVEVQELTNVFQLGAELVMGIWGELAKKKVSYRVGAEVMMPLAHNPLSPTEIKAITPGSTKQPSVLALTNIEFAAKLSVKLVEWASLDYELKALRQPQILNVFQVQNTMLLTFGLALSNKKEEKPACPPQGK